LRPSPKLIDAATAALEQVLTFEHPADAVLSQFFRENKVLGHRDRGFVAEAVYAVLRRRRWLEALLGERRATARRLLLAALVRLQGFSLRQLEGSLSTSEAGWLSGLRGDPAGRPSLAEQADLPDWLAERLLRESTPEAVLELARSLNQPAPLDLRVNPLKTDRDKLLARLRADAIEAEPGALSPLSVRLKGKPALSRHPAYLAGEFEVQDEGSQLLAYLLAPRRGEMVVDFCAGAGGKTLLLGALMRSTGRLYAFDVSEKRLARLKPRVARSGLSNVHPVCISGENDQRVKRLAGKIDRVLVDAPCSGLGTLRRNPDLKWRQSAEGVDELVRKQQDILNGAARLVKPGGRLVYATCSVLPEENEGVVNAFLAAHPDFSVLPAAKLLKAQKIESVAAGDERFLRLLPQTHGTDGFFAAVMQRRGGTPPAEAEAPHVAEEQPGDA